MWEELKGSAWILQEKTIEEERVIKTGERDDTLPPDYRPTEEDLKVTQTAQGRPFLFLFLAQFC